MFQHWGKHLHQHIQRLNKVSKPSVFNMLKNVHKLVFSERYFSLLHSFRFRFRNNSIIDGIITTIFKSLYYEWGNNNYNVWNLPHVELHWMNGKFERSPPFAILGGLAFIVSLLHLTLSSTKRQKSFVSSLKCWKIMNCDETCKFSFFAFAFDGRKKSRC